MNYEELADWLKAEGAEWPDSGNPDFDNGLIHGICWCADMLRDRAWEK